MRVPSLVCGLCGSDRVRRSKHQSIWEVSRMAMGVYPFRCLACEGRFWVSVWLFSKMAFAKCPKCLGMELTVWPERYFRPSFLRQAAVTLGAHRYRCIPCRHNFISFRPRQIGNNNK